MNDSNKKLNIFLKLKENFKMQLLVCIILCSIVIVGFLIINGDINNKKYTIVDDISLINMVENIDKVDDNITLRGYAFILERDSTNSSISVFLRNVDTGREVWLKTKHVDRSDVNDYYDCEYNYGNSGFTASIDNDKLDKDEVYEIIINVDYKDIKDSTKRDNFRTTVSSKQYIQDSKLYSYNPNEFNMPDLSIKSDFLNEVFQNGRLCFYQKDAGMYLYQYNDKLYWVATKDFKFDPDGSTYIICGFYSSQINKLPKAYREQKLDRQSFYFEEYEYKEEDTSPYRVAIRNIPKEYPITYMITGVYDEKAEVRTLEKYLHLNTIVPQ